MPGLNNSALPTVAVPDMRVPCHRPTPLPSLVCQRRSAETLLGASGDTTPFPSNDVFVKVTAAVPVDFSAKQATIHGTTSR